MALYARIENGVAVELIDSGDYAITELYAPSFVASIVRVPDGVNVEIGAPLAAAALAVEPALAEPPAVVIQTAVAEDKEPADAGRTWRQSAFAATEWLITRHRDEQDLGRGTMLKAQQYLQLLEYRQALRDWPDSSGYPTAVSRPSAPQWLPGTLG
ncbi:phage tail assembly chaperone [Pseudomonas sp. TWP3-1]|uniref:phage tail assembly chaperone n=1 Tax=Pseudomonas sp. TWP3-1 TaxID=2804631 RepID=UPI003CF410ED